MERYHFSRDERLPPLMTHAQFAANRWPACRELVWLNHGKTTGRFTVRQTVGDGSCSQAVTAYRGTRRLRAILPATPSNTRPKRSSIPRTHRPSSRPPQRCNSTPNKYVTACQQVPRDKVIILTWRTGVSNGQIRRYIIEDCAPKVCLCVFVCASHVFRSLQKANCRKGKYKSPSQENKVTTENTCCVQYPIITGAATRTVETG